MQECSAKSTGLVLELRCEEFAASSDYQASVPQMEAVVLKNGVVDYYSVLQVCSHLQIQRTRNKKDALVQPGSESSSCFTDLPKADAKSLHFRPSLALNMCTKVEPKKRFTQLMCFECIVIRSQVKRTVVTGRVSSGRRRFH
jgi:hypothetical protein